MGNDPKNYGYTTDLQKRGDMLRLWHHTGEEGDPLHYSDGVTGTGGWTANPATLSQDQVKRRILTDSIENVYARVTSQHAGNAENAAAQWGRLQQVLQGISKTITRDTNALRDGGTVGKDSFSAWRSPAADAFFAKGPGAALKSLDDWSAAAAANQAGLSALASVITQYRAEMETLFQQYLNALNTFDRVWNTYWSMARDPAVTSTLASQNVGVRDVYIDMQKQVRNGDIGNGQRFGVGELEYKLLEALGDPPTNWNAKAFDLEYRMAQAYLNTISQHLSQARGTRYEGPTNAVQVDPKVAQDALTKYLTKQLGGPGGIGAMPSFAVPSMPVMPAIALPKVPGMTAPSVGAAPGLGGLSGLPVVPTAPALSGLPVPAGGLLPGAALPPALSKLGDQASNLSNGLKGGLPSLQNGLLTGAAGVTPGLQGGVLNGPGALGAGAGALPPPAGRLPSADKSTTRTVRAGVLGAGTVIPGGGLGDGANLASSPLLPPSAGKLGQSTPSTAMPGPTGLVEAFVSDPSVPTSPSVLGRRQAPADPSGLYTGPRPGAAIAGQTYTPPGTAPPVLAGPRGAAADVPPAPATGASRRPGQATPANYAPLAGDSAWVNQPGADAPALGAPVLDGSARAARAQGADGWSPEFTAASGRPGANAPVLGRPQSRTATPAGGAAASGRAKPKAAEFAGRRLARLDPAAQIQLTVEEQDDAKVVADEEAFSVASPGGPVLASAPRQEFAVEPKPTLSAG